MLNTHDPQNIEQAVLTAYSAYFADFQRLDAAATAAHFTAPLCLVAKGRATGFPTETDVQEMLRTIWRNLSTKNYGKSTLAAHTVTVLDSRCVLLRARGTRYDRQDVPFEDFDVLYTLVRVEDGGAWRIAVITSIEPDR